MKTVLFTILSMIAVGSFACNSVADNDEAPLVVQVVDDGRSVLATPEGRTVYVFDKDSGSVSNCYNACATAWPPVLAQPGVVLGASMGTTVRNDGSSQLTYEGRPIYLFAGDGGPGEINGDGIGGVWHLIVE
jgi:predicted lipoprotein with Yx(FWY)xxD motif